MRALRLFLGHGGFTFAPATPLRKQDAEHFLVGIGINNAAWLRLAALARKHFIALIGALCPDAAGRLYRPAAQVLFCTGRVRFF